VCALCSHCLWFVVGFRLFISLVVCVVLYLSLSCVVCALCSPCLLFVVGFRLFISLVFCALLCLSLSCVVCALCSHCLWIVVGFDKHNKAKKTEELNNLNPTTNQRQWEHKAHTTHHKVENNTNNSKHKPTIYFA
jgi:hypothetical protein